METKEQDELEREYMNPAKVEELAEEMTVEKRVAKMHNFYSLKKNSRSGEVEINLNILGICNCIRDLGYFRYDMPNGSHEYVYIKDNKIEVVTDKQITDAFEDYVRQLPDFHKVCNVGDTTLELDVTSYMLLYKLYQNLGNYFSKNLERLRPVDKYGRFCNIEILHDKKDCKYLFFKDTAVEVTADGIEEIDYANLSGGYIMANSIIDRSWHYTKSLGDFAKFCMLISNNDPERYISLQSILGYLMHDYYDTDLRAAYFTDVNIDNNKRAAGGTGKGILGLALANILNRSPREDVKYIAVPGKGFDAKDPKRYSAGDITTQLIHIQDLDKRFKFEDLYNDITDGATFQKHYQNPTYRQVKIMLSMNQALDLQGSSDKRRVVIFELANFFSEKLRPENYFGHRFFGKDWDNEQWNSFYSFMANCCQIYLKYGIIEPKIINLDRRAIIEKVGEDLVFFLEGGGITRFGELKDERRQVSKATLYNDFNSKYPGQFLNQRTFTEACMNYLSMNHIRSAVWRDGLDWFILYPDKNDYEQKKLQIVV